MKQVNVSELTGAALDWAVAKASGMPFYTQGEDWPGNYRVTQQAGEEPVIIRALIGTLWLEFQGKTTPWSPSTDWSQGGPLIDKYGVLLSPPKSMVHRNFGNFDARNGWYESGVWGATIFGAERKHRRRAFDHPDQPLVAAMRAIVQFELGDVVSVPDDLER